MKKYDHIQIEIEISNIPFDDIITSSSMEVVEEDDWEDGDHKSWSEIFY